MNGKSKGTKRMTKDHGSSHALSEQDRKEILRLKTGLKVGACKSQGGCKAKCDGGLTGL